MKTRLRPLYFPLFLLMALSPLWAQTGGRRWPNGNGAGVQRRAQAQARARLARLRRQALAGNGQAANELGIIFWRGTPYRNHPAAALRWWRLAAKEGNASAMISLAADYYAGNDGLPRNRKLAARWYRRAARAARAGARRGDAAAENSLGWLYLHGRGGLPHNDALAARWFRRSAHQHFAWGMTNYGWMFYKGWGGLPHSNARALAWYLRGAKAGDATAQNNLAWTYLTGEGAKPDIAKGRYWLQLSNAVASYDTRGYLYKHGRGGFPQDQAKAEQWFLLGARRGNNVCENDLAWFYLTSPDRHWRHPAAALKWAHRAVAGEPHNDQNWDTLADAYFHTGHKRQAIAAERRALALATPGDKAGFEKTLARYRAAARQPAAKQSPKRR